MFSANRHVLSYQVTVWMACTVCSNTQGEARVQCHTFYETDTILIQLTSSTVAAVYHSSLCHSWFTLAARSAQCIINWFSYVKANAASITYSHVFCLMIRLNTNTLFGLNRIRIEYLVQPYLEHSNNFPQLQCSSHRKYDFPREHLK